MIRKLSTVQQGQEQLLEMILGALKNNELPWHQPWANGPLEAPYNPVSSAQYQNTNRLTLLIASNVMGLNDPRWMTFNQAKEKGWFVKKGSVGTKLYFAHWVDPQTNKQINAEYLKDKSTEQIEKIQKRKVIKTKGFTVFNGSQINGIPEYEFDGNLHFNNELAEEMILNLEANMKIEINHSGDAAYYTPSSDTITMPGKQLFDTERNYYSVLFHELSHATSHENRLNRKLSLRSEDEVEYAIEELRAEFSTAMLSLDLGYEIDERHISNHQAYCASWYSALSERPGLLSSIIKEAQDIRRYLLDKSLYEEIEVKYSNVKEAQVYHDDSKAYEVKATMTSDEIKESVSIEEIARDYFNFNLVQKGKYTSLQEHDSVMIYPDNSFFRFSNRAGGSVIDFVMEFKQISFMDAMRFLDAYVNDNGATEMKFDEPAERLVFELPEREAHTKNVFAYLNKSRHLDAEVINEYISNGIIYQEKGTGNCVFVGKLNAQPLFAAVKSTNPKSTFAHDIGGSFKEIGVHVGHGSDTLIVTESIIDQMSYQSLELNPKNFDYLSLNGIAAVKNCLRFHLIKRDESQRIKNIVLALDNDIKGQEATLSAIEMLNEEFPHINHAVAVPQYKDWNEDLEYNRTGQVRSWEPETLMEIDRREQDECQQQLE